MFTSLGRRTIEFISILTIIFSFTACPAQTEEQIKFGADSDYFIGLKLLSENNEKAAKVKFLHCIKKGSYYCAKKSAEALCSFGNIQEKNEAALNLVETYKEEDSLLIAVKQLMNADEINKVLELTDQLDFSKADNELIKIRLEALNKRGDSDYEDEVYRWFVSSSISKEHYTFYRDFYNHPIFADENVEYTPQQFAINYRIELYKRNYTYGFENAQKIFDYFESAELEPNAMLSSDIGKAYLYGNANFLANANLFKEMAQKYQNTCVEYYFWFYSGRFFDKANIYYSQAKNSFEKAMICAASGEQKDNALWYLLNTSLSFSVDTIIESIGKYSREWKDAEYFEDFFEALVSSLLASGKWNAFKQIYTEIDGFASDDVIAQYAYIYGRLVQEGYADGDKNDIHQAFTRACNSGSSVYYKILAAYQLGLKDNELQAVLCEPYSKNEPKYDEAAQKLLEGYVAFGFPELIYPNFQKLYKNGLPDETYFYLSDFLAKCAAENNDYATQGLRIAARGQKMATRQVTKDEIKQVYPIHYQNFVSKSCKDYHLSESVIYALIRSESFFDANVTSNAGAIGLTQLMEFTGNDIAQRLRIKEYSLTDPETNITFGTYYLSELVRRCDNSLLQAFFSYNAGITRVRRWLKSSMIEFGSKSTMPLDLYLETVPYTETRGYGRKLISATAMYEWIYSPDENSFVNIIEKLIE